MDFLLADLGQTCNRSFSAISVNQELVLHQVVCPGRESRWVVWELVTHSGC